MENLEKRRFVVPLGKAIEMAKRQKRPQGEEDIIKDKAKEERLRNLGLNRTKPIKYLETVPIETLTNRIEELKKLGFKEPIEIIDRWPKFGESTSTGISIEKIKEAIENLNGLIKKYQLNGISGLEIVEKRPSVCGYNVHRISFFFLAVAELGKKELEKLTPEKKSSFSLEMINLFSNSSLLNPYLIFPLLEKEKPSNIEELRECYNKLRREPKTKTEKEKMIDEVKGNMSKILEGLKESEKPYEKEFLFPLAQELKFLEETKKTKRITQVVQVIAENIKKTGINIEKISNEKIEKFIKILSRIDFKIQGIDIPPNYIHHLKHTLLKGLKRGELMPEIKNYIERSGKNLPKGA